MGRRWAAAAATALLVMTSVPALAANIPAVYEALYRISPATAQFFKPVQMECEDNGIRMEVEAAYIHEDTAEIYITMQDLTGQRFDETIDLFDSYGINMLFDSSGTCSLASCDVQTQTATFLILIELQNGEKIEGDKITFSVDELLVNKQEWAGTIEGIDWTMVRENPEMQEKHLRGIGSKELHDRYISDDRRNGVEVMKPGTALASPTKGVSVTGIGYVDGELRIQVYYEDIRQTDNHGYVWLRDKETGETVEEFGSISYFDEEGKGSYDEQIFTGISPEDLNGYELCGRFITCDDLIEGNWEVTFPLDEM